MDASKKLMLLSYGTVALLPVI